MADTWIHRDSTPQAPNRTDMILNWIKGHREAVIGSAIVGGAIALFATWMAIHYADIKETAWKSLFIAQQTGFMGKFDEARTQLDTIEGSFANTSAYGYAILTKGDLLFRQDKFKEAAAEYARAATSAKEEVVPFAVYNVGKAKEAANDLAGAVEQYKDFLARFPDHFLAPETHFALATVYEMMGNAAEAKAAYEKVALLYPETSWSNSAKAKTLAPVKK